MAFADAVLSLKLLGGSGPRTEIATVFRSFCKRTPMAVWTGG
jgi:hypothetical protein